MVKLESNIHKNLKIISKTTGQEFSLLSQSNDCCSLYVVR